MVKKANPTAKDTKNPKIYNRTTKKFDLIYDKKGKVKNIIQKRLKQNPNAYIIPPNFVFDKVDKKLVPIYIRDSKTKMKGKEFKDLAGKRPRTLQFNSSQIYDYTYDRILQRKDVITKRGRDLKNKYKNYQQKGNVIIKRATDEAKGILGKAQQKQKGGLVIRQVYNIKNLGFVNIGEEYENFGAENDTERSQILNDRLNDFIETIKYHYLSDFTSKQRTAQKTRVLLRFNTNDFRFFDIDLLDVDFIEQVVGNWQTNDVYGSDNDASQGIDLENLDFNWFEINLQGSNLLVGNGTAGVGSKYWYCDQPRTEFNCCFDGAINKGLKLRKSYRTVREMMMEKYEYIKWGEGITFNQIELYEDEFKVNINIYDDSSHYDNDNLIRPSKKNYDRQLNILYKDEHYALIVKPKLKINELNAEQKRRFGLYRKSKASVMKKIEGLEKKKEKKELLVVFDIETIFDRYDGNYLKPYGVSWVVWDKTKPFKYDKSIHNEEPYCYYEKGEGCLEKFVEFLLQAPNGIIYRPLGFNNSRFDNFALCGVASKMGVLNNVFMADGSILYCSITGCKNTWDACRFIPTSLDTACKNYKTNPKKEKDLIDHYEIQCFFEKNGWDGLMRLLNEREELVLYNKLDCLCLLDLTLKMRNGYLELFDEDVFDYLTISSMGYKIQHSLWEGNVKEKKLILNSDMNKKEKADLISKMKPKFNIVKPKNYEDDLFFRKSLTAG